MKCINCGWENQYGTNFCSNCGTILNQVNYQNININKKKKPNKYIFIIGGIVLVTLIISLIFVLNFKNKNIKRTFMIYMVGADLESDGGMATYELDGINPLEVDLNSINVVLIAGGATDWKNSYINKDETSIYELTPNGFKKKKQQSIKNMGDSALLSEFLNYSYENYKADEYNLIFWNHGGAIDGSEYDELSNDNLSLTEISTALSNSVFNKKKKLGTVIFGTCLNGSIEMANVFKDYANYFVASEEISISFPDMSDLAFINYVKPSDSKVDIGEKFIKKYKSKMSDIKSIYNIYNKEYAIYSTYSLVDLSKLDKLNNSLNDFFADINLNKNYNKVASVRSNLYQYAYNQQNIADYDMVDLYNLVYNLREISPKKADKALKCIENAVLYNYATNSSSRGISVYFPYNGLDKVKTMFLSTYTSINPINNYTSFINKFNSIKSSNSSNRLSFKNNNSEVSNVDGKADFELDLTDEQVANFAKAEYVVFRDNKDGYYLPVYRGKEVNLEGNKLKANIKDRQLKIGDSSYQRILTLIEDEVTDSYITYNTYGTVLDYSSNEIYEWKVDKVKLSFILDKKTNKVQIANVLLMDKNNLPSKINIDIKKYSNLELGSSSYKIIDDNGNFNENWSTESNNIYEGIDLDPNEDYIIELEDYQDGYDYYCTFMIYDINNNRYYSNLVKMN